MNWERCLTKALNEIHTKQVLNGTNHNIRRSINRIKLLAKKIENKDFHFQEWKTSSQPKKGGGYRIVIIPPFYDRIVLRVLTSLLSKKLKSDFDRVGDVSFAYQKGKSVRDALIQLKNVYTKGNVILKVDIQKFFDNINKHILIALLDNYNIDDNVRSLIQESLYPQLEENDWYKEGLKQIKNGIPQGNSISSILSNLYLLELDIESKLKNFRMIRYADDIVFVCENESEALCTLEWIEEYLNSERNLTIHPLSYNNDKTAIIKDVNKNRLFYLGIEFDGSRLFPTNECQNKLINRIISLMRLKNEKPIYIIREIKRCVSQWCGYYAFTDITDNRLSSLSKRINHSGKYKLGENWEDIDLIKYIKKSRKNQNNKLLNRIHPLKFGENYEWLMVYE